VLVIDTNEQRPLFINIKRQPKSGEVFELDGFTAIGKKLKDGDYSILGFEDKITVERKRMSDFISYIGKERTTKTIPKLERLGSMFWASLVLELSERKLSGVLPRTKLTKEHVRGFLKMVRVKYGIHVYINPDRQYLERYILDHLTYAYKILTEGKA